MESRKPIKSRKSTAKLQLKKTSTLMKKYKSRCPRCLQHINTHLKNKKSTNKQLRKKSQKEGLNHTFVDFKTGDITETMEKVEPTNERKTPIENKNDEKSELKSTVPLMYRWVAYVTEGPPGFSDSDRCYGPWCNSREEAEEHMKENIEKHCRKRFTHLRRIGRANIEDNLVEN